MNNTHTERVHEAQESHTPLPWYATGCHVQSAKLNEDNYICECEGNTLVQADANAELIVRAVNSHAALVEACKAARQRILRATDSDPAYHAYTDGRTPLQMLEAALALAEGGAA
jgi:hypothetical protein